MSQFLDRKPSTVLLSASGLLILLLVLLFFLGVILRYLLKTSIGELQIVIRFSIAWIVFLGGGVAYLNQKHLSLDLFNLDRKTGNSLAAIVWYIRWFIILAILLILLYTGIIAYLDSLKRLEPINRKITQWYFYLPYPVGVVLLLASHIKHLLERYKKRRKEQEFQS